MLQQAQRIGDLESGFGNRIAGGCSAEVEISHTPSCGVLIIIALDPILRAKRGSVRKARALAEGCVNFAREMSSIIEREGSHRVPEINQCFTIVFVVVWPARSSLRGTWRGTWRGRSDLVVLGGRGGGARHEAEEEQSGAEHRHSMTRRLVPSLPTEL